jgi:hypothetical protein
MAKVAHQAVPARCFWSVFSAIATLSRESKNRPSVTCHQEKDNTIVSATK